jgi:PAS domain S-box-containing protein
MVGGPERHWPTLCVEDRCGTGETRPVRPVEPHLLKRVFASFPASTAVLERDGTIIAVNDRWCEFAQSNCRSHALAATGVGVNYLDVCRAAAIEDPLAREALAGLVQVLNGEQATFSLEYPCHSPHEQRWFMLFAARLQGEDGAVVAHLDITARRQTEDELRRTQGLLQSILDHTPALVFVKDLEQRYLLVNRRCEEVFGVSSDTIRGKTAAEVFPAEMARQFAQNDNRTLMGDAAHQVEETVPTPDGPMVVASTQFPIRDADGRAVAIGGISIDITARKEAEARQQTLVHELNHRTKNLLAVVHSVARNTFEPGRNALDQYNEFAARLRSLARAQDLAIANRGGAQVRDIVAGELEGFGERIEIDGPDLTTKPSFAQMFALVVHELATNAAKYGALSSANGHLTVRWAIARASDGDRFCFSWRERGGPSVRPPAATGFGSRLIRSALPQKNGDAPVLTYDEDGFRYEVAVGLDDVIEAAFPVGSWR